MASHILVQLTGISRDGQRTVAGALASEIGTRDGGSTIVILDPHDQATAGASVAAALAGRDALVAAAARGSSLAMALATHGLAPAADIAGPEAYDWRVTAAPRGAAVVGNDGRAAAYGAHWLAERVALARRAGQVWPAPAQGCHTPHFPVRRWSVAIAKPHGGPLDDVTAIRRGLERVRRYMRLAHAYGVNSVEINGRPSDGWDVDWLVTYRAFPALAARRPAETWAARLALLQETAAEARGLGLDLYSWSHELYVPPEFFALYPETRGTNYPLCPAHPTVQAFLAAKYAELFEAAPDLAGIVLSLNESGHFSVITDAGCQCDRCRGRTPAQRIQQVLRPVIETCRRYGRQLVLRTFQAASIKDLTGHPELETIRTAFTGLPNDVQIMSKYCPLDFYGTEFPDESLIGAFPNPHLVEFSLDREWQGRTFLPCLTPRDFRRRLQHAMARGCVGTVARLDFPFPMMEPEEIFEHPNEFNVFAFGRLSWDPHGDLDEVWSDWGQLRYGAEAGPAVVAALKETEEASQRTLFTKGIPVVNYHNMIPALAMCVANLWDKAPSKWNAAARPLTERLLHPDEALIAEVVSDTAQGRAAAERALRALQPARTHLSASVFQRLASSLEKLHDTAILWTALNELFFRYVAWAGPDGTPSERIEPPNGDLLAASIAAAQQALAHALHLERRHGPYCWPVFSPDRGVSVYEFVGQVWAQYLAAVLREPAPRFQSTGWRGAFHHHCQMRTGGGAALIHVLDRWEQLLALARREPGARQQLDALPKGIASSIGQLTYEGQAVYVTVKTGGALALPLPVRAVVAPGASTSEHHPGAVLAERTVDAIVVTHL